MVVNAILFIGAIVYLSSMARPASIFQRESSFREPAWEGWRPVEPFR